MNAPKGRQLSLIGSDEYLGMDQGENAQFNPILAAKHH